MVARHHNNRSEKQKGHGADPSPSHGGHQGAEASGDRDGTDRRQDGKGRQNGGGDGAGGPAKAQGQGQANEGVDNQHQGRNHS